MKNTLADFYKAKHSPYNPATRYLFTQDQQKHKSTQKLVIEGYGGFIHGCQKLERTHMIFN